MSKSTRVLSTVLLALPSAMLVLSAVMKLSHAPEMVEGFSKTGLGNLLTLIGIIELASVVLLWIPGTQKLGFLLLCSYLGGAICMELAGGKFPVAAVILAILWIAIYIREKQMFLSAGKPA